MDWVDRPQNYKGLYGTLQLLQGSHLGDFPPVKTLNIGWVAFHFLTAYYIVWPPSSATPSSRRRAYSPTATSNTASHDNHEKKFMGFLFVPLWACGSVWWPLGPLAPRYKACYMGDYLTYP